MSDLHPDADSASPGSDRYTATPAPTFGSRAPVDPNDRYTATPAPVRQQFTGPGGPTTPNYKPIASLSRPGSVSSAVIVTWVVLAVYAAGLGRYTILYAFAGTDSTGFFHVTWVPSEVSRAFTALAIMFGVLLAWAVAAFVVSIFAFAGRPWARLTLAISGGLSVPFQLGAVWPWFLPSIGAMATVAVIVVLFTPDANDWYRRMS